MKDKNKIMGAQIPIEIYKRVVKQLDERNMTISDVVRLGIGLVDTAWGAENE